MLREDIYYAAYQKLYANKGATTQGIDDDTADGFSDFYVKELIQTLKDGTYKANPVKLIGCLFRLKGTAVKTKEGGTDAGRSNAENNRPCD